MPKPPDVFKRLYAKVYKEHYSDIMEQIETFAAYGTPIQKHLNYENIDDVFTLTRARTRRLQRSPSLSALVKTYIFRSCFLVFYFIIDISLY